MWRRPCFSRLPSDSGQLIEISLHLSQFHLFALEGTVYLHVPTARSGLRDGHAKQTRMMIGRSVPDCLT